MSEAPDEPRWLDDAELSTWLHFAAVLVRVPGQLDRQLQQDSGLTLFEYQVMAGLSEAPERTLRLSVLAAFAEGQLPRLSQVAARLEKKGWLSRRTDPSDGRYTLATLTDQGMSKVVAAAPGHVATVRDLVFDRLTAAQARQLGEICRRIVRSSGDCRPS